MKLFLAALCALNIVFFLVLSRNEPLLNTFSTSAMAFVFGQFIVLYGIFDAAAMDAALVLKERQVMLQVMTERAERYRIAYEKAWRKKDKAQTLVHSFRMHQREKSVEGNGK